MSDMDDPAEPGRFTAREHLAWLMWCYDQGYTNPADRAILTNWMGDDPATMHPDDVRSREGLLTMADEVLAIVAREQAETADDGPHGLACAVCLYTAEGTAPAAVTVIGGLAVCEDHLDRAHDGDLSRAIAEIRKERQS